MSRNRNIILFCASAVKNNLPAILTVIAEVLVGAVICFNVQWSKHSHYLKKSCGGVRVVTTQHWKPVFISAIVAALMFSNASSYGKARINQISAITILYVLSYQPGKNYKHQLSIYKQDLIEHAAYMRTLTMQGKLILAGPFTDGSGAQILLRVKDETEAKAIAENDPAIKKEIFNYKISVWDIRFNAPDLKLE